MRLHLLLAALTLPLVPPSVPAQTATQAAAPEGFILPSRPVPTGMAPKMKVKLIHEGNGERVFAIIFSKDDEVLSGLTDFAIKYHVTDAHFTAIGAVSSALTSYIVPERGLYHALPVNEQCEVASLIGDIATHQGKPIVHNHIVLTRHDGTTASGHLFEAHVNPTLEVFLTADDTPLVKVEDPSSGIEVIAPAP